MRKTKTNFFLFLSFLVAAGMILVPPVMAFVVTAGSADFTAAGENKTIDLILDEAPQGIAGYSISASVIDPSVGQITGINFPAWASMNRQSTLPSASVDLLAVDLGSVVKAGSNNVVLATLTVQGLKAGSTGFSIDVKQLDTLGGGAMVSPVSTPINTVNDYSTPTVTVSTTPLVTTTPAKTVRVTTMETRVGNVTPGRTPVVGDVNTVGKTNTDNPGRIEDSAGNGDNGSGAGSLPENAGSETIPQQGPGFGILTAVAAAGIAGSVIAMKRR